MEDDDQKLRVGLVGGDGRRRYDPASKDRLVGSQLAKLRLQCLARDLTEMRVFEDAVLVYEESRWKSRCAVVAAKIAEPIEKHGIQSYFALVGKDELDALGRRRCLRHHRHLAPAGRTPGSPQIDDLGFAARGQRLFFARQRLESRGGKRIGSGAAGELPSRVPHHQSQCQGK